MGSVPGTIRMLDSNCLDGLTETTHGLPLGEILKDILSPDKIFVIGIEPRSTDFSLALSPEVEAAAQRLACALMDGSWTGIPRNSGL
jgi:Ni,Fe-hydrogenase maturation factor